MNQKLYIEEQVLTHNILRKSYIRCDINNFYVVNLNLYRKKILTKMKHIKYTRMKLFNLNKT